MAGVTLAHITKTYPNGVKAVDGVSLAIADHEFVALVGPSGCGKSTTLRLIAGLEALGDGEIRIGDRLVNDVEPKDRDVAMVFQNYALYPHMTVYGNLSFALRLRMLPPLWKRWIHRSDTRRVKDDIRRRVLAVADMLDIRPLLDRKPRELSGGQRQRVAVGRAIVRNPAVFLFDEPLSNLDARLRLSTRTELKRLHQQLKVTTVYVTHDQEEAMSLGDRIVVMLDGKIQQCDEPLEVYNRPRNRFVAGFVGTPPMNFFDGIFVEREGVICFQEGSGGASGDPADRPNLAVAGPSGLTSPDEAFTLVLSRLPEFELLGLAARIGQRVVLGIRPEHLLVGAVTAEQGASSLQPLTMRVVMAEPLGGEIDLTLASAAHASVVARVAAPAGVSGLPKVGERVRVHVDLRRVHLFEPGETGMNLSLQTKSVGQASDELSHAIA